MILPEPLPLDVADVARFIGLLHPPEASDNCAVKVETPLGKLTAVEYVKPIVVFVPAHMVVEDTEVIVIELLVTVRIAVPSDVCDVPQVPDTVHLYL